MIDYTLPLDQLPDPLPIEPLTKPFDVTITPPGSKSITCRAYVLAALKSGWVINPLVSDDTEDLRVALSTLGARFSSDPETPNEVFVDGVGGRFPNGGKIQMGEGGAPTRFVIACACLSTKQVFIDASPRMRERPVAEGIAMLQRLGASIEYQQQPGQLPIVVKPSDSFRGGILEVLQSSSSQFISAVMLVAPYLEGGLDLRFGGPVTSKPYIKLTQNVLRQMGYEVLEDFASVTIKSSHGRGGRIIVEPDATAATYWLAAAALSYSARIKICLPRASGESFTSWQGDWQFPRMLTRMGAIVEHVDMGLCLSVRADGPLKAIDVDMSDMPDAALTLAVLCSCADSRSTMTGLRTLRVKETDRIVALANELRRVGCTIETGDDWISITPPHAVSDDQREEDTDRHGGVSPKGEQSPRARSGSSSRWSSDPASRQSTTPNPVIIETYNDHRMAMAFAVLGLARPGISIRNPACVAKSYPGFWKDFAKLYQ